MRKSNSCSFVCIRGHESSSRSTRNVSNPEPRMDTNGHESETAIRAPVIDTRFSDAFTRPNVIRYHATMAPRMSKLNRFLPLLLLLFASSGCAALIYEVIWFQLLQLVIGSSAISLGVLLGTYMGGMCIGSLLLPRFVPAREHPLRIYVLLELGIGICGILVLFGVPLLDKLYAVIAGHGLWGIVLRAIIAAVCLLPPTLLMGASLPAIGRWIETTPQGVSWLGFFYGGNIAGAVFGCLLAGFYLLRVHDQATATYVAWSC